ncbi:uncharacterized protein LOC114254397, partial [Monomorium pharaonis]|uniref:uncharacterized protein LOC114254397 n=1 Tax=Monomorium pharaonis TaxID=307658 RepID=UPI0017478D08
EYELRDELWFIEFGRGAALPLTPEEAPVDGEPVVPCAQGRIVVETARPAPPHFATCSTYRRPFLSRTSNDVSVSDGTAPSSSGTEQSQQEQSQQQPQQTVGGKGAVSKGTTTPQSPAMRPEDLSVKPWYMEDYAASDTSPGPMGNRSSYLSYADSRDGRMDLNSTRNSSIESEFPKSTVPRKACMDLKTAMALLDETCPNVEPSPSLTPRTPRTPLTPYATRSKRARSKSSDNSSNYSNDRLSDRSFEVAKDKEKKRPFLKKIGISKTEDRPFLAKLAPRIIGKPYLQKIGPSKAIEKPFLDKIGSSKTLDKFIFDTSHNERKNELRNARTNEAIKYHDGTKNNIRHEIEQIAIEEDAENLIETPEVTAVISRLEEVQRKSAEASQTTFERRRSGKEFLLKMYSFETEDLESPVPSKEQNTQLGTSLDDVLDSGPNSLPTDNSDERAESRQELEKRPTSVTAELLKCRVTTSEEIISSSTTCLNSPSETNSWNNSPRRAQRTKKDSTTMIRRRIFQGSSHEVVRTDNSTPNSPTKRPISSVSPDREIESRSNTLEKATLSPTKNRKSNIENIRTVENTRRSIKYNQFERRGISSDNLLAKDALSFVTASRTMTDNIGRTREISSEDSLATHREYTKETFKQLQDKFKLREIPMESYATFKRRTKGVPGAISRQERLNLLPGDLDLTIKSIFGTDNVASTDKNASETAIDKRDQGQEGTVRSILRKQEGIDHPDQESDTNASLRRPLRRIFHEPSQETMDLLTELRKVKSLLKTPSWDKDLDLDQKPERMPKRISLTDKEFCLSVERENSVRRPSRMFNSLETTEEGRIMLKQEDKENKESKKTRTDQKSSGPALFEKKCLSLDYADEEKPPKPEARAISLASARDLPSEIEGTDDYPDMIYDSKSCFSSVFNSPSEETNNKDLIGETTEEEQKLKKPSQNHCAEVDIAIPVDQKMNSSKGDVQGRTSDLYEIISPRSTPFRVKKRLGKISVEETVKPENFTLGSKVDCRSVVAQKRTKCFPL